jgi:hypothetical protein
MLPVQSRPYNVQPTGGLAVYVNEILLLHVSFARKK